MGSYARVFVCVRTGMHACVDHMPLLCVFTPGHQKNLISKLKKIWFENLMLVCANVCASSFVSGCVYVRASAGCLCTCCARTHTCARVRTSMCTHMCMHMCTCVLVWAHVCPCVCMHLCVPPMLRVSTRSPKLFGFKTLSGS